MLQETVGRLADRCRVLPKENLSRSRSAKSRAIERHDHEVF